MADLPHYPVMLSEMLKALFPKDGETYIDGTLGAGGYTKAILDCANCNVISIDRDKTAIKMAESWASNYKGRLKILNGCFGDITNMIDYKIDGLVLDLGVSSMQIDQAERGFSFRFDGPLDMRMGKGAKISATEFVNTAEEKELANIIYKYGEERHSRKIAKAIIKARQTENITTTKQLADIIRDILPKNPKSKIDPATKTFQAIRIYINDELGEIERVLESSIDILKPDGRLVVVTFHSLEDRIVKQFFKEKSGNLPSPSRHLPVKNSAPQKPIFRLISKKAIEPSEKEISENTRSRSAKLRYGIRQYEIKQEGA